jgi:predicted membrane-bound spermidine synthase
LSLVRALCGAVFFGSGLAALMYQVIWQRILAIFSGADVFSVTIIVAAFMAGLGLGSLAGGQIADRVTARTSLMLFGLAELAIAAFGYFSAHIYYDLLYARLGATDLGPAAMAAVIFASLVVPTILMGGSLPLLARALTDRLDHAATTIGSLYGVNTLGAATGALVATWWLLPSSGLEGSLRVAAMVNAACALVVLPLAFAAAPVPGAAAAATRDDTTMTAPPTGFAFGTWVAIYAFAGFLALSFEIAWFRTLGVMMKSTAFTFGTLLTMYLGGLGFGSIAGNFVARRITRHAGAFLALQAAAGLLATGLIAILVALADETRALRGYFGSYEPIDAGQSLDSLRAAIARLFRSQPEGTTPPANFLRFYVAIPAVLVVPPTFLMGCSFPVLQRVVQTDLASIGRRVGTLLLANIAGSVAGTMVTGWLLLDFLGTPATLKLLTAMSGGFALLAVLRIDAHGGPEPRRRVVTTAAGLVVLGVVAALALAIPGGASYWARLHGSTPEQIVFREDGSGVSLIKVWQAGFGGRQVVYVNGLGQSTLPYGDIHTALGAVPAFLHPAPRRAAVIGLGSGDTVHAVAGRPDIQHITAIEIVRPQLATLRELGRRVSYAGLRTLLRDSRIEHVYGDGRIHLMRDRTAYDIIEADALRPGSAYAGNLYSEEYFRLLRGRLTANGLAATWAPTGRVRDSFLRVFPHVVKVPGIMIGSTAPIDADRAAALKRAADPRVRSHYGAAGIDIDRMLTEYLASPAYYDPTFPREALTDVNTDLFPRDEYDLRRR